MALHGGAADAQLDVLQPILVPGVCPPAKSDLSRRKTKLAAGVLGQSESQDPINALIFAPAGILVILSQGDIHQRMEIKSVAVLLLVRSL